MSRPLPNDVITPEVSQLLRKLAGTQDADGTYVQEGSWVWVQAFADFDYEYSYLLDVRYAVDGKTVSDYLAFFEGYDSHGQGAIRYTWFGHAETFPKVPDVYEAMAWWAQWTKQTRRGEHGQDGPNGSGESTEGSVD